MSFGAAVGLPVALLASQLHWGDFNVAVAVVRAQWCYYSTVSEAKRSAPLPVLGPKLRPARTCR
jgi:hypothetical protein